NTKYQTIQGDSFEGLKHQAQFSLFAQDNWNVGGMDELRIVAGFRLDYAPALGEMSDPLIQATPKLSIRWDATPETIIRSSYGMGYKLPSLKQKYWTFNHGYGGAGDGNFILVGNPDLEPEKSHGVNLSVEQKIASDWTVSAAGYFNHIRDLIDSVEIDPVDGQNRRTYVNINKALTYGGDISIGYRPGDFSITGGYAYTGAKQWIENEAKYEDLPFRVPHKLSLQTVYRVPAWATEFSMSGSWNSPQLINQANNSYTPDLFMLNARISKDFGENFSLYLRGDNLLNNIHFINGTTGDSQTEYFELYDGFILTLGGRLRF
ncbi:MAG: TonB-dependent receptor, partial [Spirochaetales bacterium]|nr:TonB-dependent receptor [Spirochaetales bacterium]